MIDIILWATATAYQKWKSKRSVVKEGSVEDLRLLKDMVEALKEDNDLIAGILEAQKKKHDSLETQIAVAYLFILILTGVLSWPWLSTFFFWVTK